MEDDLDLSIWEYSISSPSSSEEEFVQLAGVGKKRYIKNLVLNSDSDDNDDGEITIERKNESSEDEELIKDIQRAKKQSLKYINNEEVVSDYETEEDIEEIIEASEEVEEEVNVDDEELIDDTIEIDNNDIPEDNIGLKEFSVPLVFSYTPLEDHHYSVFIRKEWLVNKKKIKPVVVKKLGAQHTCNAHPKKPFTKKKYFERHLLTEHFGGRFQCKHCKYKCSRWEDLRKHCLKVHSYISFLSGRGSKRDKVEKITTKKSKKNTTSDVRFKKRKLSIMNAISFDEIPIRILKKHEKSIWSHENRKRQPSFKQDDIIQIPELHSFLQELLIAESGTLNAEEIKRFELKGIIPEGKCPQLRVVSSTLGRYLKFISLKYSIALDDLSVLDIINSNKLHTWILFLRQKLERCEKTIGNNVGHLVLFCQFLLQDSKFSRRYGPELNSFLAAAKTIGKFNRRNITISHLLHSTQEGRSQYDVELEKGGILADDEIKALFKWLNLNFNKIAIDLINSFGEYVSPIQYIYAKHHGYLPLSLVKYLIYAQGICYHLFAFALLGQRAQINTRLLVRRFGYYKDNDRQIFFYSPESEKVQRKDFGIVMLPWIMKVFYIQALYIRPVLKMLKGIDKNDPHLWIGMTRIFQLRFFQPIYNNDLTISESRTWRRTIFTKFISRNLDFSTSPKLAQLDSMISTFMEAKYNVSHGIMCMYYNRQQPWDIHIAMQEVIQEQVIGQVEIDSIDSQQLLDLIEEGALQVVQSNKYPKSRGYIIINQQNTSFSCFTKGGQATEVTFEDSIMFSKDGPQFKVHICELLGNKDLLGGDVQKLIDRIPPNKIPYTKEQAADIDELRRDVEGDLNEDMADTDEETDMNALD